MIESSCDILVLGGGPAALIAAIRAKQLKTDANVVLVCKASAARSGAFTFAGGHLNGPARSEEVLKWVKESVVRSDYTNDQELVETILRVFPTVVEQLEKIGVTFIKKGGEYIGMEIYTQLGGVGVPPLHLNRGGIGLLWVLRGEALRLGVKILDRVMVTDLLTSDGKHPTKGRVVGAIGLGVRDGNFHIFKAKASIVATGCWDIAAPFSEATNDNSGDGIAMSLRAGAEIRRMEFVGFGSRPVFCRGVFLAGGIPLRKDQPKKWVTEKGEYEDTYVRPESHWQRALYTHFSFRGYTGEEFWWSYKLSPIAFHAFHMAGFELPEQLVGIGPSHHSDDCGGVKVNKRMETTILGLFAAGDATEASYIGIRGGTGAVATGWIAAESALRYAQEVGEPEVNKEQVERLKFSLYAPLDRKNGVYPIKIRGEIAPIFEESFGPVRNEDKFKKSINALTELTRDIEKVAAKDTHMLMKALEVKNMIEVLEVALRAALMRTESRDHHQRSDYPNRDDKNWLKWIIAKRREDGILALTTEDYNLPYFRPEE